jgi:hypothetical protein
MTDARDDDRQRTKGMYQAYGLGGRCATSFNLDELRRLFQAKYGYPANEARLTAGGGTVLVGPVVDNPRVSLK